MSFVRTHRIGIASLAAAGVLALFSAMAGAGTTRASAGENCPPGCCCCPECCTEQCNDGQCDPTQCPQGVCPPECCAEN